MAELEPTSPPAAKRQRTEAAEGDVSISEASPAKRTNGAAAPAGELAAATQGTSDGALSSNFSSAPAVPSAPAVNGSTAAAAVKDDADEEDEEEQAVPEEEDLTRRDMYLDTVRPVCQ